MKNKIKFFRYQGIFLVSISIIFFLIFSIKAFNLFTLNKFFIKEYVKILAINKINSQDDLLIYELENKSERVFYFEGIIEDKKVGDEILIYLNKKDNKTVFYRKYLLKTVLKIFAIFLILFIFGLISFSKAKSISKLFEDEIIVFDDIGF